MKVEPSLIYNQNGLIPIRKAIGETVKIATEPTAVGIDKTTKKENFKSLLSEAEAAQLTSLFGKFDLKILAESNESKPDEMRPGRIIDIVV